MITVRYADDVVVGFELEAGARAFWGAMRERFKQFALEWRRTLRRRSQKDKMTLKRMDDIANSWLPRPRILHPWPSERFAVNHPRWEPSA